MRTLVLTISGMSCEGCVEHLTASLRCTEGVRDVEVDLLSGSARVDHDDEVCTPNDLINAVRRAGYQVAEFQQVEPSAS